MKPRKPTQQQREMKKAIERIAKPIFQQPKPTDLGSYLGMPQTKKGASYNG